MNKSCCGSYDGMVGQPAHTMNEGAMLAPTGHYAKGEVQSPNWALYILLFVVVIMIAGGIYYFVVLSKSSEHESIRIDNSN